MTPEQMADALKALGWIVEPPITQETCKHPTHMVRGSVSSSFDGSGHSEWTCLRCGKHEKFVFPAKGPTPYFTLMNAAA